MQCSRGSAARRDRVDHRSQAAPRRERHPIGGRRRRCRKARRADDCLAARCARDSRRPDVGARRDDRRDGAAARRQAGLSVGAHAADVSRAGHRPRTRRRTTSRGADAGRASSPCAKTCRTTGSSSAQSSDLRRGSAPKSPENDASLTGRKRPTEIKRATSRGTSTERRRWRRGLTKCMSLSRGIRDEIPRAEITKYAAISMVSRWLWTQSAANWSR